ncbi:hypothetical protein ES703_86426 [subsurface metagenome]
MSYLKEIPEVTNFHLDPSDNSTLFIEFATVPEDFKMILGGAACRFSRKKEEFTGVSGVLIYGTKGGTDIEQAFWFVQARYGIVQETRRW